VEWLNKLKQKYWSTKPDEVPSPSQIPTVVTYPPEIRGKERLGKSTAALIIAEKVAKMKESKELEESKKKVIFDDRISQVSKIPKDELNGKKNMLVQLKSYIADVKMRERCMGCDYRHHIMTKEERKQLVDMLNRISMLHTASGSKRIFMEYKKFDSIECICLAKKCPYGYFHGDEIEKSS